MHVVQTAFQPGDRVPMSWEECEALGLTVRGESIDGELVMMGSPTRRHQQISRRLANLLEAALPASAEVVEGWGWKPGADEFIPDLVVVAITEEDVRLTSVPYLAVEVLSSDPAADIIRKAAKFAAAGLERHWIIDPDGPVLIDHGLVDGVLVERARHLPGDAAALNFGPFEVTLDPADLVAPRGSG